MYNLSLGYAGYSSDITVKILYKVFITSQPSF
jgi:hypothetical protein